MSEELPQSSPPSPPSPPSPTEPRGEHSEALLQSAIERLKARGDSARRFGCMSLPAPIFNDLCARLLDRQHTVKATAEWLAGQTADAPTRSSVERFSDALFEEYRLAQLSERRRQAESYVAQATGGNPDAQQMALNTRLTELLTDELLNAENGEAIETKRLMALMMGARVVAQTAFDKQKMDTRIKSLEQQIVDRDANIRLKDQKLNQLPEKIKALQDKLALVETAQAQGKKIDPRIYSEMRAKLVEMAPRLGPHAAAGGGGGGMTDLTTKIEMTPDGPIHVLTEKQRDVMRQAIEDKKHVPRAYQASFLADASRYRRLRWSRQTGKSYIMGEDAVLMAGETSCNVMQLSASADLTKELMLKTAFHAEVLEGISGEIQRAVLDGSLESLLYVDSDGVKITQTTVTLQNGQRVIGRPANPRTARGFTAHVQLDEFAMQKDSDEIWASAHGSITSDDRLRMTVASTPKGKKGRFYQIAQAKTVDQGGVWSDHTLTIYDAVRMGLKIDPEQLKNGLDDDDLWAQEYLVEFVDESSSFLTYDMIRSCEHEALRVVSRIIAKKEDKEEEIIERLRIAKVVDLLSLGTGDLYLGVDVGRRRDLTTPWLMQDVGGILWPRAIIELHTMPFRHQQSFLAALIGELGIRRTCIDETGLGMMLAENLAYQFGSHKVEPITFTENNKARLAEGLKPRFDDKTVRVPVDNRIREDLHGIAKTEGAGGHVRYAGEKSGSKGKIHPDHFWGLALAVNAATQSPVVQLNDKNVVAVSRDEFKKGVLC